jgi:HK97 family phage prohead protease
MSIRERFAAHAELKFKDGATGEITGYASVFGVLDAYGDLMMPGAFDVTLAEHKSKNTMPHMYAEHSAFMFGGDPLPIGKWDEMAVDDHGLKVSGKLIAMDHPDVKRVHDLMVADVMSGLSIAWAAREDGAVWGTKAGEPRRTLTAVDLYSVDPVCDPAQSQARIQSVKSAKSGHLAVELRSAWALLNEMPESDERTALLKHISGVYTEMTGEELKAKSKPDTIRQFEDWLRDAATHYGFKYSNSEARALAEGRVWKKTADPREEEAKSKRLVFGEIGQTLSGFSLPK